MVCNDPHVFAGMLIGCAVGSLALVPVVVSPTPERVVRNEERRRTTLVRKAVAAGCSALFLGLLAILSITYLSGGIRLCR